MTARYSALFGTQQKSDSVFTAPFLLPLLRSRQAQLARILRSSGSGSYRWRVLKSIHSPEYLSVLSQLVAMRKAAGLTQRQLAQLLNREHSFVWRLETGERRLDVVEFFWVCKALNQPAAKIYSLLVAGWEGADHRLTLQHFPSTSDIPSTSRRARKDKCMKANE